MTPGTMCGRCAMYQAVAAGTVPPIGTIAVAQQPLASLLRGGHIGMRVFVTGGSGFVGGRLIERLVADGDEVRALGRSDEAAEAVSALGAEPVRGDVTDESSIAAGAAGCEVAYHSAAKVEDYGPWEDFERVNVDGSR